MPYIKIEDREFIDDSLKKLNGYLKFDEMVQNRAGVLNYVITKLLLAQYPSAKYSEFNEAIGVLECAKLELYRRRVAEYEDKKILENGDVYPKGGV